VHRRSSLLALLLSVLLTVSVAAPAQAANSGWDPNDTKNVLDLKWVGIYRQDPDTTRVSITFWNPVRDWMRRWGGDALPRWLGVHVHQLWAESVWSPRVASHVVRRRLERGTRTIPSCAPEPLHPPGVASQLARHGCGRSDVRSASGRSSGPDPIRRMAHPNDAGHRVSVGNRALMDLPHLGP
jgi:hypothetical protein